MLESIVKYLVISDYTFFDELIDRWSFVDNIWPLVIPFCYKMQ